MKYDLALPEDKYKLENLIKLNNDKVLDVKICNNQISSRQRRALHLYFTLLSKALNDGGFDIRKVIDEAVSLPFSAIFIKEYIWKQVQITEINKESTTDLKKPEVSQIYKIVDQIISERTGVHVEFPNWDYLLNEKEIK